MEGKKTLDAITRLGDELKREADKLRKTLDHESSDATRHARHFRDAVIPVMVTVRDATDTLEGMIPHDIWPLATYREMLFIK